MKICIINGSLHGSTGSIVLNLASDLINNGHEVLLVSSIPSPAGNKINTFFTNKNRFNHIFFKLMSKIDGRDGFTNSFMTRKAIEEIKKFKPDIIHVHNVHGYYFNFALLIDFAQSNHIPVLWTLHDCWILTGRCCSFDFNGCNKWKNACGDCPFKNAYPRTILFDRSRHYWILKRKLIEYEDLQLVSPSLWLSNLVKNSGLAKKIAVINNGIDHSVFNCDAPKLVIDGLGRKKKLIGFAAYVWSDKKGLKQAIEISAIMSKKGFQSVFLGFEQKLDGMPSDTICLKKTNDQKYIASFYSSLDCFVNTTQEDNFPTVNIESIACGTPVATFNVGGAAEMVINGINGYFSKKNDIPQICANIEKITNTRYSRNLVSESVSKLNIDQMLKNYLALYENSRQQ